MKNLFRAMVLLLATPFAIAAQTGDISGTVKNASGEAVPFAIVNVEGTYNSAQTASDGSFVLHNVRGTSACLAVHMLGYQPFRECYALPIATVSISLLPSDWMQEEVVVNGTRVNENSGMAYTNVSKEEIEQLNFGQDLPYLLNMQPSVVTTSDAGTGVGYTGIRIRGVDNTRVNVTINGIPVNDAESQGTYWVDIPDVASSTDNIQVQRGVGTSTNGAGAFGGSVSVQTDALRAQPFAEVTTSAGSFNTFRVSAKAGSGLLNDRWAFETRLSKITSDGYIDRGSSDLSSWYMAGGWYGKKLTVKAITFSGRERTYQCWYGVPQDSLATNRTYNPAGEYYDRAGNLQYYPDQVDNYQQDYYQLHFILNGNAHWNFNTSLFATHGKGYYEEYRMGDALINYGFSDSLGTPSDLVRRLWLDNWYYGAVYGAHYSNNENFQLTIGGAATNYEGQHFDRIIWGNNLPPGTLPDHEYNRNFAHKSDVNVYVKANYTLSNVLTLFGDLQYRNVGYHFTGVNVLGEPLPQSAWMNFFNPKAGLTIRVTTQSYAYASFAVGNKEPNRDDFKNSSVDSRPVHEMLYDAEAGWKFRSEIWSIDANLYYMHYVNQLVLTGKVNDVGAYTRQNVAQSYRRGLEMAVGCQLGKSFNISYNATLSQNKIVDFHEFIDDYDNGVQVDSLHALPDIAFSPAFISALQISWEHKGFRAALQEKFVGKQFLDNTSNETRKLDPYFTSNLYLSWTAIKKQTGDNIRTKRYAMNELTFGVQVNNLFNTLYVSNGYTYGYVYGQQYNLYNYYYPQAGVNVMGMVTMKF